MGLVRATGQIGKSAAELTEMRFLVDTGTSYSAVPQELREQLDLPSGTPLRIMLADRRVIDSELTTAYLKLNGRESAVPVEIVEVPEPLLGVSALEAFGLKVNPRTRALEEDSPWQRPPTVTRFRPPSRGG
ncbi:MAG: hypothetical protein E6J42_12050 [Chloroflexi bacterium]|nr:MAG: hypothetical protein E6J42_12050 [Chloroflexota bacterium]